MNNNANVTWHEHAVAREAREQLNGHGGSVIWFTGLSGSGKSTVANAVDHLLHRRGVHTFLLDGDNVRMGLNAAPGMLADKYGQEVASRFGLGFSAEDRTENIRRIGAVAQLFCSAGIVTLSAFVSPYRRDRDAVRQVVQASGGAGDFVEVFVDTPLEVCEARDPKGLYKKARAGEIKNFTGIDDPYETPNKAELRVAGDGGTPAELADQVIAFLVKQGKIHS